jgi:mannose-6-phosphate isomerase-like protein (cupin superfamily)
MVIRNWREVTPTVGHESAVIWPIFMAVGTAGLTDEEAPLLASTAFTRHMLQGRKTSDYHEHGDREQVYYFLKGRGKMKIDGEIHDVVAGDAVHLPPKVKHQLINDSEEWIDHLIFTAVVG